MREPLVIGNDDDRIIFKCLSCDVEKTAFRVLGRVSVRDSIDEFIQAHRCCEPGLTVFTETEAMKGKP